MELNIFSGDMHLSLVVFAVRAFGFPTKCSLRDGRTSQQTVWFVRNPLTTVVTTLDYLFSKHSHLEEALLCYQNPLAFVFPMP